MSKEFDTIETERRIAKIDCQHCSIVYDDPPTVTIVDRGGPCGIGECPECERPNVVTWPDD